MQNLLESLAADLEDKIRLGKRVTKIRTNNDGFEVVAGDDIINCKFVIVTISVGVLQHELNRLFEPPLPSSKVNVIESFGMGTVAKIFLRWTAHHTVPE